MAQVTGVGGVFFKSDDPKVLGAWYAKWLKIDVDPSWGGASLQPAAMPEKGYTSCSPFKASTTYFEPSESDYMINLIVDDLTGALQQVEEGGATLVGKREELEFGSFGWFMDPDGNKVELWQPK